MFVHRLSSALLLFGLLAQPASGQQDDPRREELQLRALIEQVTPAVVGIRFDERFDSSGVIVNEDGLVLTHAHHTRRVLEEGSYHSLDQTEVDVRLHSGNSVRARLVAVVYSDTMFEYSLLQLREPGPYPFARTVRQPPERGARCLLLGHPLGLILERPPVARYGTILGVGQGTLLSNCLICSGDSGGPLFDETGAVIGINITMPRGLTGHTNVAAIRNSGGGLAPDFQMERLGEQEWQQAEERRRQTALSPFATRIAQNSRASVVEIICDGLSVALGTVISQQGHVVTKASELLTAPKCKLSNGELIECHVVGESLEHDLAVLRLDSASLTPLKLNGSDELFRGKFVVSPGVDGLAIANGIISDARIFNVPADPSSLEIAQLIPADRGVRITELHAPGRGVQGLLRKGDVLLAIDTYKVPNGQALEHWYQRPPPAGSVVNYTVERAGREIQFRDRVSGSFNMFYSLQDKGIVSYRRTGFPAVFAHDSPIEARHCGGPLVDLDGQVIGITIARSGSHESLSIPARVAKKVIHDIILAE